MSDRSRLGAARGASTLVVLLAAGCGSASALTSAADAGTESGANEAGVHDYDATAGFPADAGAEDARQDADLLAPCTARRDVFYVDIEGSPGPFQLGPRTYTNVDSNWLVSMSPYLDVIISAASGGGSVEVYTSGQEPPKLGTYSQSPGGPAPWLSLAVGGEICSIVSGSFTLLDLQYTQVDGAPPEVSSLRTTMDLACAGYGSTIAIRGCVAYAK